MHPGRTKIAFGRCGLKTSQNELNRDHEPKIIGLKALKVISIKMLLDTPGGFHEKEHVLEPILTMNSEACHGKN